MGLADDFDAIDSMGPPRRKKKAAAPVDTNRIQAQIIAAKDTRADAIGRRDKARADSSSLASMSDLAGREWMLRETAKKQDADAAKLGKQARDDDALIARTAAKIGAKTDTLKKARKP